MLSGDDPHVLSHALVAGDTIIAGVSQHICLLCAEPAWKLLHYSPKTESPKAVFQGYAYQLGICKPREKALSSTKWWYFLKDSIWQTHETVLYLFKGFGKLRVPRDISAPPLSQGHNYSRWGSGPSEDKLGFSEPPVRCMVALPPAWLLQTRFQPVCPHCTLADALQSPVAVVLQVPGSSRETFTVAKSCKVMKPHSPETPCELVEKFDTILLVEHIWSSGDV